MRILERLPQNRFGLRQPPRVALVNFSQCLGALLRCSVSAASMPGRITMRPAASHHSRRGIFDAKNPVADLVSKECLTRCATFRCRPYFRAGAEIPGGRIGLHPKGEHICRRPLPSQPRLWRSCLLCRLSPHMPEARAALRQNTAIRPSVRLKPAIIGSCRMPISGSPNFLLLQRRFRWGSAELKRR